MKRVAFIRQRAEVSERRLQHREMRLAIIGLWFAAGGTLVAAIALAAQIFQMRETEEVNRAALEMMALERLESLRGQPINVADHWVVDTLNTVGDGFASLPLYGLTFHNAIFFGGTSDYQIYSGHNHDRLRLFRALISGIDFDGDSSFKDARFTNVHLSRVRLTSAKFERAMLWGLKLDEVNFSWSIFADAQLYIRSSQETSFAYASFAGAGVTVADIGPFDPKMFDRADFRGAKAIAVSPDLLQNACLDEAARDKAEWYYQINDDPKLHYQFTNEEKDLQRHACDEIDKSGSWGNDFAYTYSDDVFIEEQSSGGIASCRPHSVCAQR